MPYERLCDLTTFFFFLLDFSGTLRVWEHSRLRRDPWNSVFLSAGCVCYFSGGCTSFHFPLYAPLPADRVSESERKKSSWSYRVAHNLFPGVHSLYQKWPSGDLGIILRLKSMLISPRVYFWKLVTICRNGSQNCEIATIFDRFRCFSTGPVL